MNWYDFDWVKHPSDWTLYLVAGLLLAALAWNLVLAMTAMTGRIKRGNARASRALAPPAATTVLAVSTPPPPSTATGYRVEAPSGSDPPAAWGGTGPVATPKTADLGAGAAKHYAVLVASGLALGLLLAAGGLFGYLRFVHKAPTDAVDLPLSVLGLARNEAPNSAVKALRDQFTTQAAGTQVQVYGNGSRLILVVAAPHAIDDVGGQIDETRRANGYPTGSGTRVAPGVLGGSARCWSLRAQHVPAFNCVFVSKSSFLETVDFQARTVGEAARRGLVVRNAAVTAHP